MQIDGILSDRFAVVSDDVSLAQAAARMLDLDTDVLAVRNEGVLVGTLSVHDLALAGYGGGCDPHLACVADVLTPRIAFCPLGTDLEAALHLMNEMGVEALLVGEPEGEAVLLGLVTRRRVLEALADPDLVPRGPLPEHVQRVRGQTL